MHISSQALFTAIKEDPKQAKALIKATLTPDIQTSKDEINPKQIVQKATQNANQTLDKIFSSLSKGEISKNQAILQVQKNPIFKSNTTAVSDMKSLINLVQKEPKLSKFLQPLKDFVKHISLIDAKDIKSQINKSGIGLEAKLAAQTKPPLLPLEIKDALKQIIDLKPFSEDKNLLKDIKTLQNLAKTVLENREVFKQDIKNFRQEVANSIKNIPNTPLKIENILNILDKIDTIVKKLDIKNFTQTLTNPKAENLPQDSLDKTQNIQKQNIPNDAKVDIKTYESVKNQQVKTEDTLKQSLKLHENSSNLKPQESIKNETTSTQNVKLATDIKFIDAIKRVLQDIKIQINSSKIELEVQNQIKSTIKEVQILLKEQTPQIQTITQQPQVLQLPTIKQSFETLNLQDKIKMLTSRIKQSLELENRGVFENFKGHKTLKHTLNTLDKNLSNLPYKQSNELENSLKHDIKQTLNHLKDSSIKDISNLSNKIITNIEANQLLSFANNSINTYIPYAWESLKEGNIAFKKGKDDTFFCQLDLNLKVYGRVNMMLMLTNDSYISVSIGAEKEILTQKVQEHLKELKQAFLKIGITPLYIKFKPFKDESEYNSDEWSKFSMNIKV